MSFKFQNDECEPNCRNVFDSLYIFPTLQNEIYVNFESTFLHFYEKLPLFKLDIFSSTFFIYITKFSPPCKRQVCEQTMVATQKKTL